MICPYCQKEGRKSKLYLGLISTPAGFCLDYYDENGNFVKAKQPVSYQQVNCSNGHRYEIPYPPDVVPTGCPDWDDEPEEDEEEDEDE